MNGRVLVLVQKFDWVFDGNYVIKLRLVNQIDDGRQGRTLSTARRAGHQDDPVLKLNYVAQLWGQIKVLESRRPVRNDAHDDRVGSSLFEDIHAKAAQPRHAERKIIPAKLIHAFRRTLAAANHRLCDPESLRR